MENKNILAVTAGYKLISTYAHGICIEQRQEKLKQGGGDQSIEFEDTPENRFTKVLIYFKSYILACLYIFGVNLIKYSFK